MKGYVFPLLDVLICRKNSKKEKKEKNEKEKKKDHVIHINIQVYSRVI